MGRALSRGQQRTFSGVAQGMKAETNWTMENGKQNAVRLVQENRA
ncbi:hypothetical protein ACULNC_27090 [Shigella flexneri]